MAVSQMSKVHIYAHDSLKARLIKHLQDLKIIHITNLRENLEESDEESGLEVQESEAARNLRRDLSNLDFAIDYLKDYDKTEGGGFLSGGKILFSPQEYQEVIQEEPYERWHKVANECRDISDKKNQLDSRKERLQDQIDSLYLWSNLDVPIEDIADTENVAVRVGSISTTSYPEMLNEIRESDVDVDVEVINETQTQTYIFAVFLKEAEETMSSIMGQYGFTAANFPGSEGRVSDIIGELNQEIAEIESQKKELEQRSSELSAERDKLMAVYDHLSDFLGREEIKSSFLDTKHTFLIEGWVRKKDIKLLQNSIPENWEEVDIQVVEPDEDEEPPIDLRNSSIIEPFQMVTNLYGKPRYRELDPTPLLAPFFAFFFGVCITDAGYGILMTVIATVFFLKIRKSVISRGTKQLIALLVIGGLTTVLAGVLTDGFFGWSFDKVWKPLSKLSIISPVANPADQKVFLRYALYLGFFQVWLGFVLKFYMSIKQKDFRSAFRADMPWIIIGPAVLGLIFMYFNSLPEPLKMPVIGAFAVCSIWIIALSDLEGGSIGARIGNGFFNWYGIASAFGDVLSYSRIFALGLATGIIATVVNTIVFTMIWPMGTVGIIIGVLVFVVGHIFNLVINALGGFIHTARLQFVEYFTKFYEGGGEEFKPFSKESTYTAVMELN
jgi:V/A-type H+-transporting ATPase subunit I